MNVCMLAYTYYESDNRVRRYAETFVNRGDSVDAVVLRQKRQSSFDVVNGVRVYRIQERTLNETHKLTYLSRLIRFLFRSALFLKDLHSRKPYDVIHVHSVPDFEVFAALPVKYQGPKIILDIHDLVPEFYGSKFGVSKASLVFKSLVLVERLSIRFSDHVIISNHLWYEKLLGRSANPENCTTIVNYPDPSLFHTRQCEANNERLVIMYPGTLNWHQGLDIAIKAFATVKAAIPNTDFHIYGDGPERVALERLITELDLKNRVFIKGPRSIDEIARLMADATIGIVPKRNDSFGGEAFSTKILEFMAEGVPLIVSATRIDRYYFDDSVVRFFEPENEADLAACMVQLIKDAALRERLAQNGLQYVAKNNWGIMKQDYLAIVDRLTNNASGK